MKTASDSQPSASRLQLTIGMLEGTGPEEVKDFLADICAYLEDALYSAEYENTSHDSSRVMSTKTLHVRCKKLLLCFNGADGPNCCPCTFGKEEKNEYSYLDMNGKSDSNAAWQANAEANSAATGNDYILMSQSSLKQNSAHSPMDGMVKSNFPISKLTSPVVSTQAQLQIYSCPYALIPAKSLETENQLHQSHLLRLGRRSFFSLPKKYYSRLLPDWLLCYADANTNRKPSLCLRLQGAEVHQCEDGKRHQHCFELNVASGKRYTFQSNSATDVEAWISSICLAISGEPREQIANPFANRINSATTPSSALDDQTKPIRQLPTPPPSKSENFASVVDERSGEDIYEEPYKLYREHKNDDLVSDALGEVSNEFPLVESPERIRPSSESYDVPKTRFSIPPSFACKSSEQNQSEMNSEIPTDEEGGVQDTPTSLLHLDKVTPVANVDETTQVRSAMHERLPEPEQRKDAPNQGPTAIPVRGWLRKKFGKSNYSQKCLTMITSQSQCKEVPINGSQGAEKTSGNRILLPSAKGEKVNMIVSQLVDSKGGLPIFRCNASETMAAAHNSSL